MESLERLLITKAVPSAQVRSQPAMTCEQFVATRFQAKTAAVIEQLAFDFATSGPKPIELLRDGRGIYGIGVSDFYREREEQRDRPWIPRNIILRPDRFDEDRRISFGQYAVLQKITGGFRHGMFCNSVEDKLRQYIHHEALRRAGLQWPPRPDPSDPDWWSNNKKQQARNRAVYHGLRVKSLNIINGLIGAAIEGAADADALKAARRFSFQHREHIYRAAALSRRALQLTETFPLLALVIYADSYYCLPYRYIASFDESEKIDARKKTARALVERGARLRDVAALLEIPTALRCIKPGAAHCVRDILCQHPELICFMPDSLPRARIWLRVVGWAAREVGADYARWVARHAPHIPGREQQVGSLLSDFADWVCASRDEKFVTRPFTPSMSLKTVTAVSKEWHEAVAANMDGPQFAFPAPWYPAAMLGGYEILPIDNSADLYREGAAMHHCAGTYANDVRGGGLYVYSIRGDGKRLATMALCRNGPHVGRASLIQIRGPCNAEVPKTIVSIAQRWLRSQGPLPPPPPPAPRPRDDVEIRF
jgi:hypothetical protein